MLTCSLPLVLFLFLLSLYCVLLVLILALCLGRLELIGFPLLLLCPSRVQLFKNDCCREAFEKLNSKHKIWAEHSVILDEVDPAIRTNLESRGWLSLLEIDHPPPTALIREFFSNLSCHIYDSNTLVRSWIRVLSSPLPLGQWLRLLGFRSLPILSIPMMSLLL